MVNFFKKVENIFLILCLLFGLIFIVINPPFQVSDEYSHFYKMYSLTEGTLNFQKLTEKNGETYAGSILPESLEDTVKIVYKMPGHLKSKMTSDKMQKMTDIQLDKNYKKFIIYFVPAYSFLSYMPGIIILEVMKWFNVAPIYMMYVLRLSALLAYILLVYYAIKITPVKKWLFLLCGLVPTAIYQASGVSTDGLINGLMFLYIAYTFNLAFNDKLKSLTKKNIIILLLLLLYITICKFPYAMSGFLLFIIPKEKFPKNFNKIKTILSIAGILIGYTFLNVLYNQIISTGLASINPEIVPANETLLLTIHNPQIFFGSLFRTLNNLGFSLCCATIAIFGWSDTFIPFLDVFICMVILFLAGIFQDKSEPETEIGILKNKFLYLFITIGFVLATLIICYLLFSYQDYEIIKNVQGRYFVALLPLWYLSFYCKKSINYNKFKIISIIFYLWLMLVCVLNIIHRFYF